MGDWGFLWFGEARPEDEAIVDMIAKQKRVSKEIVKKHYTKMLKEIYDETKDKDSSKD